MAEEFKGVCPLCYAPIKKRYKRDGEVVICENSHQILEWTLVNKQRKTTIEIAKEITDIIEQCDPEFLAELYCSAVGVDNARVVNEGDETYIEYGVPIDATQKS